MGDMLTTAIGTTLPMHRGRKTALSERTQHAWKHSQILGDLHGHNLETFRRQQLRAGGLKLYKTIKCNKLKQ